MLALPFAICDKCPYDGGAFSDNEASYGAGRMLLQVTGGGEDGAPQLAQYDPDILHSSKQGADWELLLGLPEAATVSTIAVRGNANADCCIKTGLIWTFADDAACPAQNRFFCVAPQSVRRPLLMPQVNPGSLYRCDKSD